MIKILLADDHKMVREGLRSLLDQKPDLEVVGEAEDGRQAVRMAIELQPDVVVMDLAMPELNGVGATTQIKARAPGTQVIALSIHSHRKFVIAALEAGASGYLLKDSAFEELEHAIRAVASNLSYLSPEIAGGVIANAVRNRAEGDEPSRGPLSGREREVLQLIAEGKSARMIAERLRISVATVNTHRQHVKEKLGLESVAELTKYAIREGLTSVDS